MAEPLVFNGSVQPISDALICIIPQAVEAPKRGICRCDGHRKYTHVAKALFFGEAAIRHQLGYMAGEGAWWSVCPGCLDNLVETFASLQTLSEK